MSARPIYEPVAGSPFQPGDRVRVTRAIDAEALDVSPYVGKLGGVAWLEYGCGCAQSFPGDPMIGVRFDGDAEQEFWREELEPVAP